MVITIVVVSFRDVLPYTLLNCNTNEILFNKINPKYFQYNKKLFVSQKYGFILSENTVSVNKDALLLWCYDDDNLFKHNV